MKELIDTLFKQNGIVLTADQIDDFVKYMAYLKQEGSKYNLTSIDQDEDITTKHFIDSVLPADYVTGRVLDVGSGAGFPGVPLKIINPSLELTAVDSVNKKVVFINNLCVLLNMDKVNCVHSRVEDLQDSLKNSFETVVSRAVAKLNTLVEYCLPFVKVGGYMIAYKSIGLDQELTEGANAINTLGGQVEKILNYNINGNTRKIVIIKKIKETPLKYPRKQNKPRTNPL